MIVPAPSEAGTRGRETGKGYLPWRGGVSEGLVWGRGGGEILWYHWDDEIAVVQGSVVEVDEDVVFTEG